MVFIINVTPSHTNFGYQLCSAWLLLWYSWGARYQSGSSPN